MTSIMDTETYFICCDCDYEKSIPDCFEKHQKKIEDYVLIQKIVSDLNQLFQVFRFNLRKLTELDIRPQGIITYKKGIIVDYYEINALTQNLLSSSTTLINGIESYLTFDDIILKKFKQYTSNIYDSNWYYRFFSLMRNYTQHGHLSISQSPLGTFSFDLKQISMTMHFNFGQKYLNLLTVIQQAEKDQIPPNLDYAVAIEEYILLILQIYDKYLNLLEDTVKNVSNQFFDIIDQNYDAVKKETQIDGFVAYKRIDNDIHLVDIHTSLPKEFDVFRKENTEMLIYFCDHRFLKE